MQSLGAMALFVLLATGSAEVAQTNPLGQVLSLLSELSAKVTNEGAAEDKDAQVYAEWCDDVSKNTKFEIQTASTRQEKLEATIGELAANIDAADSKISGLAASVSTGSADLEAATSIREKEAADFAVSDKALVETVDTLNRAVTVLEREMQKNPASFAQVANKGLAAVFESLGVVVDAAAFSVSDRTRLLGFIQARQGSEDDDSELGAPAAAVYKTHSSGIFDVLDDLKEKAEAQLSDVRKAEVNAKHNYAMLKQSLVDQLAADNKGLDAEKTGKASAREGKATAEGDLSVTVAELKAAEEALQTATANCAQVAADHEASVKARDEELKVIAKAIEILKSTSSGAVGQTYSLLQVKSVSGIQSRADLARSEVVTLVKNLARKHHSAALAQLASRIAAVERYGSDPFSKVKGLIQSMIEKLQNEAQSEATEKEYCDTELSKSTEKNDELNADISKLTTKIDQAAARSAELKADVKELQSELAEVASEQSQMDQMRSKRHGDYVQAKADLELGLSGVRKALVVLRNYYAKSEVALLQEGDSPALPGTHTSGAGAGTSIIGILEVVESDFAANLAAEETEESTLLEAYEKNTQENKITTAQKDQDVKYKTKEHTGLDKDITELSSDRETSSTERAAVMEYLEKLRERCIAKPETYQARSQRRQAEIAGLKEALSILSAEASFVQRGGKLRGSGHHARGALSPAAAQ